MDRSGRLSDKFNISCRSLAKYLKADNEMYQIHYASALQTFENIVSKHSEIYDYDRPFNLVH